MRNKNWKLAPLMASLLATVCCDAQAEPGLLLYGSMDMALTYASNQNGKSKANMRNGNLAASKFGFKGGEDLGNGTQLSFILETGFDTALPNFSAPFNRQTTISLANPAHGALTVGRQYTPYYLYVGPLGPTTAATGATGAHPGDIDGLDTTIRIANSISYASPLWSGAQVSALYGFGESPDGTALGNTISAAFKYARGPWNFGLGYLRLKNGNTPGVWSSASTSFNTSPINNGYVSADMVEYLAAATRYSFGKVVLGANLSSVAYRPGVNSLFAETATFDTVGLVATWQLTPAWFLGASYSYTRERAANSIGDPARYHQLSLEQTYSLSRGTTLYFLEAYQRAGGTTLGNAGAGNPVNAVAVVGDSQNGTPSSGRNQAVLMLGIRHIF